VFELPGKPVSGRHRGDPGIRPQRRSVACGPVGVRGV